MRDEEKLAFGELITGLCFVNDREASKEMIMMMWMVVSEFPFADVERAIKELVLRPGYMPKPADLREAVEGKVEGRAIAAWADVQKAMPLGAYKHIDFEDPLINAVIRSLGGWPSMFDQCATAESEKWFRHNFIKDYMAMDHRNMNAEACRPLAGISQAEVVNGKKGDPVPRRIGCDDARKRIAESIDKPSVKLGPRGDDSVPVIELKKA